MYNTVLPFDLSKKFFTAALVLLSLLLAAYGPMTSISTAQSAIELSKLQQLKAKALESVTERISTFQATLASMGIDVKVSKDSASISFGASTSPTPSTSANPTPVVLPGEDGFEAIVDFPETIKTKAKEFLQKIIEELTQMKEKVTNASSLTDMQSLSSNLDAQSGLGQLTNVQGAVTQSIQSLTGVFDNLKSLGGNLQSRVTQLKDCVAGNDDVTAEECEGLNTTNSDVTATAQSQLDNMSSIMSTIATVLMSSISLLMALMSTFTSMAGGLGGLAGGSGGGGLGGLSNLSNLTSAGDISSMTSGLSGVTGLLTSFTGMASQLDIASGMGGNLQGMLGSLSGLVNI